MSASPTPRTDAGTASGNYPHDQAASARLIAATTDVALARALQALAEDVSVVIVDDLRKLSDEMLRHGSNLALIDSAIAEAPLEGIVDSLISQFPDLRLMVAGHASEQNLLASRLADETVFRFVHKPASPQRLKLFLEAASRESGRRREPVVRNTPPKPPSKLAFVVAGLVAVCVAAAAAWIFWPHGAAARLNARDLGRVEEMLRQANAGLAAKRFVGFDGTSAAELYRDVLQLDKANEPARTGLDKSIEGAINGARESLASGKLDAATNGLEAVKVIAPEHAGIKELTAQIATESQRQLSDEKARQAVVDRQLQIHSAVERMEASIGAGKLLDPDADSATLYFQTAQDLSPGDPAVRAARSELTSALVAAGDRALLARRLPDARRFAAATARINTSAAGLAELLQHIDEAGAAANAATTVSVAAKPAVVNAPAPEPVAAPPPAAAPVAPPVSTNTPPPAAPAVEPATTQAAVPAAKGEAAWIPGEGVVAINKLKIVRSVPPEFPPDALNKLVSGWVELEFTVGTDGGVKDVAVTASEPNRIFDNAASAALRRFRFAPVLKDGQPVEQRARTRMRFTATEQQK
ncbi:MAG: energy transducer TonB [Pseudomonadota bacterium]